jgi:putative oxygen-independent coproporphyrinogen III oxidase
MQTGDKLEDQDDNGFGIYVHWPFCTWKCPYCDFNSHVRESIDQERWRRALICDLEHGLDRTPASKDRTITSVFFGGGTPSLMNPELVAGVLGTLKDRGLISDDAEITLEANPSSADAERFEGYRECGVNRLSVGVQALDDGALRFLGRLHDVAEAMGAIDAARAVFDRVSFDLIYARQAQTPAAWREELRHVLELCPSHVSLYQLTIERGTRFHEAHARGDLVLPSEDEAAEMYEDTVKQCADVGLIAYEVSNFAYSGEECRHNLTYWRSGDWLGVGPGAHGRIGSGEDRVALRQWRSPEKWRDAVEGTGSGLESADSLSESERVAEALMMGLRLTEGVLATRFARIVGASLWEGVNGDRLDELVVGGFLERTSERILATPRGRIVLNTLIAELLS